MVPGTRGDGLRLLSGGNEIPFMRYVGGLAGVVPLAAAARNGIGTGYLVLLNGLLSWQAPGSSTPGVAQNVSAGGTFLLEDGADTSKWIRVTAYPAYLPLAGSARIYLEDTYNALGPDDVTAGEAAAGATETATFALTNVCGNDCTLVKLWIDPATNAAISISLDGATFYQPVSEIDANVLAWAVIAAGASATLWVKRIIGAGASSNAKILNALQWTWKALN